jgi:hypothetical protein
MRVTAAILVVSRSSMSVKAVIVLILTMILLLRIGQK